jgi:tetratricopeptide (TPR) repeat protein
MTHDLRQVVAYYEQLLAEEHDERRAVGWRTSYAQDVAFLALGQVQGLRSGVRVLDVGCGLGALKDYFDRSGLAVDYTGYDIVPAMVERARRRHPEARFEVRDILRDPPGERFDFVFCSGVLATSALVPARDRFQKDMIRAMLRLCHEALAFNLPSSWAFMASPTLQRDARDITFSWPEDAFRFCKTLSRNVTVAHDTNHLAFTVFVYRNNRGALARYLAYARPGRSYGAAVEAAIHYHAELGLHRELVEFLRGLEPCAEVWSHLGQTHAALREPALAFVAFERAIAADPTLPGPHLHLGKLVRSGSRAEAVGHFRRAVAAAPDLIEAHEQLVRTLLADGRRADARAAVAAMPEGPLRDLLGALATDEPEERLAGLERALQAAPRYVEALVAAASAHEDAGRPERALELLRRARTVAPLDEDIARRVGALSG